MADRRHRLHVLAVVIFLVLLVVGGGEGNPEPTFMFWKDEVLGLLLRPLETTLVLKSSSLDDMMA